DHPRDAGPRLPRRHRRDRTSPDPPGTRTHRVNRERDPAPVHQPARPRPPRHRTPAALVTLATPPPSPRPRLPPPTSSQPTHLITNYGWSTRPRLTHCVV